MISAQRISNIPSPALAQEYHLTQAQFHALGHCFATAMKFDPSLLVMRNSVLSTVITRGPAGGRAVLQADYSPLLKQPVSLAIVPEKATIKNMGLIRGAGDVRMSLETNGFCRISGDHTQMALKTGPFPGEAYSALPDISWIGTALTGYDPKDLKKFIGNKSDAVQLAVYGDQLEQIGIHARGRYTFTVGMAERLANRNPDTVLKSQIAFRYFGTKQSIQLGTANGRYFLQVTNSFDIGVDLVVIECLGAVVTG